MKDKITLKILAILTDGELFGKEHAEDSIDNILFDSRRLNSINHTAFFAIVSKKNSAERYIPELYNKGIRMFVTQIAPKNIWKDATFLVVSDVVKALQTLAKQWRDNFTIPVCAITGSNGKTITKDWIVKLIGKDKKVCSNAKSYNSQIGVPISVYNLTAQDEIGIFEAGISKVGEMENLEHIIQPTIGIFTNIGDAHQTNFTCIEQKIEEKLKLFAHCKTIIYHDYNPLLTRKIEAFSKEKHIETISWGDNSEDTYKLSEIENKISLPFSDTASVENAINAYVFCLTIGIDLRHLSKRIKHLEQLEMRFEVLSGINNSIIINDSYCCDFTSLEIAIDYLNRQNKTDKVVILSDLQQSSTNLDKLYTQIDELLHNKKIDSLIAIGADFYNHKDLIHISNSRFYHTVEDFLLDIRRKDFTNKAILIKGASTMHFERITNNLSNKVHQSVLEINLSALEDNVRYLRSFIKEGTKVMAMVKASSYGCGGYEVAAALEKSNLADYFTVAFADEGVELRQQGIQTPIMVMTPEEQSMETIKQYNLEPVMHSFLVLNRFLNDRINVHIKLDTGMHRLGFEPKDIDRLITILQEHPNIHVMSVFSHLYGADDMQLDKYTYEQIEKYTQMSDKIVHSFDYKIIRHLANSAATVRFPQAHFDMVRLGIGMYGIGVDAEVQKHLRYVHRLRTTITQTREIEAEEDVSYSRKFVSKNKMRLGVIPIGYADGLNRHLGNEHLSVWVNGSYCPIVGNICMDMCMIDITNTNAKEGDMVVIFGNENPVFKLSDILQTIPYEIFTSVSNRVKRIYYQE